MLGTIGLAIVLLRNVLERRREMALLRAVGYNSKHFTLMVVTENAFLVCCGLVTGTLRGDSCNRSGFLFRQRPCFNSFSGRAAIDCSGDRAHGFHNSDRSRAALSVASSLAIRVSTRKPIHRRDAEHAEEAQRLIISLRNLCVLRVSAVNSLFSSEHIYYIFLQS